MSRERSENEWAFVLAGLIALFLAFYVLGCAEPTAPDCKHPAQNGCTPPSCVPPVCYGG